MKLRIGGWVIRREEDDWETQREEEERESERYYAALREERRLADEALEQCGENAKLYLEAWGHIWAKQHRIQYFSTCVSEEADRPFMRVL